ncbi:MAG TPA: DUF4386 domain-containing protein [Pyrinomonadaceae bacterium]
MRTAKSAGRVTGILLLTQFLGLMIGFILLVPITTRAYLENAATASPQVRLAVLLLFVTALLTIAMSIFMFAYVREHCYKMSLWLLALSVVWCAMQAVDNEHILSLITLSQQNVWGANDAVRLLGEAAHTSGRWTHYTELLVMDVWYFSFYLLLFRSALVPRALAAFALLTVIVHMAAIPLPVLLGYSSILVFAYALLLSYLVMSGWLLVKGFNPNRTITAET